MTHVPTTPPKGRKLPEHASSRSGSWERLRAQRVTSDARYEVYSALGIAGILLVALGVVTWWLVQAEQEADGLRRQAELCSFTEIERPLTLTCHNGVRVQGVDANIYFDVQGWHRAECEPLPLHDPDNDRMPESMSDEDLQGSISNGDGKLYRPDGSDAGTMRDTVDFAPDYLENTTLADNPTDEVRKARIVREALGKIRSSLYGKPCIADWDNDRENLAQEYEWPLCKDIQECTPGNTLFEGGTDP